MDIAAIINAAIATTINNAVTAAVAPLQQEIAALKEEIAGLKNGTAQAVPVDSLSVLNAMDNSEWFWNKINSYIERNMSDELSEAMLEKVKEIADAAAEEAISDHADEYDHDGYDSAVDAINDFEVDESMVKDTVKEVLRGAAVSIDI